MRPSVLEHLLDAKQPLYLSPLPGNNRHYLLQRCTEQGEGRLQEEAWQSAQEVDRNSDDEQQAELEIRLERLIEDIL